MPLLPISSLPFLRASRWESSGTGVETFLRFVYFNKALGQTSGKFGTVARHPGHHVWAHLGSFGNYLLRANSISAWPPPHLGAAEDAPPAPLPVGW